MKKAKGMTSPIASDHDYRAESDARTLSDAEMIKSDKARHKPALKKAAQMSKDKMKEAKILAKLTGKTGTIF